MIKKLLHSFLIGMLIFSSFGQGIVVFAEEENADIDNNIPYNANQEVKINDGSGKPARYILTEVRNNE